MTGDRRVGRVCTIFPRYNELQSVRQGLEELRLGSERIGEDCVRIHPMFVHPLDFKVTDPGSRSPPLGTKRLSKSGATRHVFER